MIQFWMTPMGKRYYEHTMPELVKELHRLNNNLERFICTFWDARLDEARATRKVPDVET